MDINELILRRRTIRKFKQEPISDKLLIKYVNAARFAPSAANLQPLKYVIVKCPEMLDKVFKTVKWAGYLAPKHQPLENERPVAYIIVCVDTNISRSGYELDAGASIENIILSALSDGIGACWLGSMDKKQLSDELKLKENLSICSVIALGYPKEEPKAVKIKDDIKYYLDVDVLCVPKREIDDVLIMNI